MDKTGGGVARLGSWPSILRVFWILFSQMVRIIVSLILSVLATAILFIFAGMAGGACHCMTMMYSLFPYGAVIGMRTSFEATSLLLILIQFPLYATTLI